MSGASALHFLIMGKIERIFRKYLQNYYSIITDTSENALDIRLKWKTCNQTQFSSICRYGQFEITVGHSYMLDTLRSMASVHKLLHYGSMFMICLNLQLYSFFETIHEAICPNTVVT